MHTSPENLAMFESDWPGASWDRGKSAGLPGPRRGDELGAHISGRLAKFHAPEIVFGPGAGFSRYAESGCDVIIGLGGGSCIDAAKGVAILSGNGGRILRYEGVDKVLRPIPPTVMVPSTSGTGADVSQFAIVTDTAARKKITIISRTLVPEISVIDPHLLTTMPDWLNATTGLDALTHGIESFVSGANNPLTDRHALHAVALITRHLLRTQLRPTEMASRLAMAQGSLEAGMAFTNAILGATHAMSHQVGGHLDAPHGVLNAVPKGLAELGVTDDIVPRTTLNDACLATNPRAASVPDIEDQFRAAL
jgi:alcohol dehydrogenase class IV